MSSARDNLKSLAKLAVLVFEGMLAVLRHVHTERFRNFIQDVRRRAYLAKIAKVRRSAARARNGFDRLRADDGHRRD